MTVRGITASYYWATDLNRATDFYTALLGMPPASGMPNTFSEWVFPDDTAFGVYKGDEFKPSNGVMFIVDDVAAAIAELQARGVSVSPHVEETPVCFMGFGSDSEGNGFILHAHK